MDFTGGQVFDSKLVFKTCTSLVKKENATRMFKIRASRDKSVSHGLSGIVL